MKAIINTKLTDDYSGLQLKEIPKPKLKKGELLVKASCSSINPSDDLLIRGKYVIHKEPPFCPGLFALGTVEKSTGMLGIFLKGKRVWCSPGYEREGSWAEYVVTDILSCIPINKKYSNVQALSLGNAVTAVAMIDKVKENNSTAVVINAAASNVGCLVNQYAQKKKIQVINIVRSAEQIEKIQSISAKKQHILNQNDPDFISSLQSLTHELKATIFFDSVGGSQTPTILSAMPNNSCIYTMGHLSGENITLSPIEHLMKKNHILKCFMINEVLNRKNLLQKFLLLTKAKKLILSSPSEKSAKELSMEEVVNDFKNLVSGTSKGKVIINFDT